MINTILFDLDGTLLPMDTTLFTKLNLKGVAKKFKDYLTSEEDLKHMWKSAEHLLNKDSIDKSNKETLFEHFYERINHTEENIDSLLEDFYENEFNNLREISCQNEDIIKSVHLLKEKGYELVIVSNPVFPKSALIERIKWAGLDETCFKYITSFEEMHFAKPSLNYYKEVLAKIDKSPLECMMVGNNIEEDMVAHELGIKTYLIEDFAIGEKSNGKNVDFSGNYKDFYEFSRTLPKVK